MKALGTMTNGKLMLICLIIFAAVLIFPRLMRRKRIAKQVFESRKKGKTLTPKDFQGKQKLFYTHNAKSSEIEELLVKLKSYALKRNMKIVFPGCFRHEGQTSQTTMILAGPFGLLLIRCYGFGGHIYTDPAGHTFFQNMNETVREIPNPIQSMEQEKSLMRRALSQTEFQTIPIHTASVFTRKGIILSVPGDSRIFNRNELFTWLGEDSRFAQDNQVKVTCLVELLVGLVKQREA